MNQINNHANLIWGIAELLRGYYKQSEYGRVILPLVVMRRLDQALEPTKQAVLDKVADLERRGIENMERPLRGAAGLQFFNRSPLSFSQLLNDPGQIAVNLRISVDGRNQSTCWIEYPGENAILDLLSDGVETNYKRRILFEDSDTIWLSGFTVVNTHVIAFMIALDATPVGPTFYNLAFQHLRVGRDSTNASFISQTASLPLEGENRRG